MRGRRALKLAAVSALALALAGCVVISPFGSRGNALHETTVQGQGDTKILWLPISGFISDAPAQRALGLVQQPSTLATVSRALDKAAEDEDIGAVVLRINSPGGTVAAADEIHARIARYRRDSGVPVIASFGGVAASGGYYVATAADTIIAQPTSITGSIGVIIPGVNASELLDKLGVDNASYVSGKHKDIMSPLRKPTPEEQAIVQNVIDSLFARFVAVVEAGRPNLDRAHFDEITDGRILAADDAQRLGLVDEIGHIDDVLALARDRAGVESARVIRYYQGRSAPNSILSEAATAGGLSLRAAGLPVDLSFDSQATLQPLYLWQPATAR
ncbi:putative signal peptide peptidase SppA [Salinisphaera sp. T5B8]|uniref:signal peptide peptidase SppA n=1 Tax=Salinisphaera sp. T5B8 TaxID=1304154 RepID=UPI00334203CA